MESAKREVHEAGLNLERLAAVRDADDARGGDHRHTQTEIYSGAEAAVQEVKKGEVLTGVQAESQDHTSAALGSVFDNDTSNDDNRKNKTEDQDDSATLTVGMNNSSREHQDCPLANSGASRTSQDQSPIATKGSLHQPDNTYASPEASDSSQRQSHSSGSSSGSSNSSDDCACPTPKHSKSVEVIEVGSFSDSKTSSPPLNPCVSLNAESTIDGHHDVSIVEYRTAGSVQDHSDDSDTAPTVITSYDKSDPESKTDDTLHNDDNPSDPSLSGIDASTDDQPQSQARDGIQSSVEGCGRAKSVKRPWLTINNEALKHIATYFLPGSHGACVSIVDTDQGGTFHEIRVLTFEDGRTCIGRFTRESEPLTKTESELATIEYVRKHTSIPVPRIYFVNHNRNHVFGSAFVLMERLEGVELFDMWEDLTFDHKVAALEEVANVVGQLAELHFDRIGSLTYEGSLGPLINLSCEFGNNLDGPFATFKEYVHSALDESRRSHCSGAMAYYRDIKKEIQGFLTSEASNPTLQAPFRLIHTDLEFWNILVTRKDKSQPPKISGVIDWNLAFVGPMYYLCEYPPDITDLQKEPETFPDNKKPSKSFVKAIARRFPKGSDERDHVKRCFREKSEMLNVFPRTFTSYKAEGDDIGEMLARSYLSGLRKENPYDTHHPYGCYDQEWVPDSDPESDDDQ